MFDTRMAVRGRQQGNVNAFIAIALSLLHSLANAGIAYVLLVRALVRFRSRSKPERAQL
jgi:hypothetical protein